jgi:predicted dehydrogenase
MAAQRRVKTAVIGVGLIGQQHADVYAHYPRADLRLVYDVTPARAQEVAQKYGCKVAHSLEEVANSDVEVVSVATPDFAHRQPVITMLQAGKHVVVEKPLATNVADALAMVQAAEANRRLFTVSLGNRWAPDMQNLRESVQSGEIGEPVFGYSRLSDTVWVPTQMLSWASGSGPHWFLFPHNMDYVRWILQQEAVSVYASGEKRLLPQKGIDAYDFIQAMVKFERCTVTFETSWIVPEGYPNIVEQLLTLYGTKGKVQLDRSHSGFTLATEQRLLTARPHMWTFFKVPDWWGNTMRDMVDCVLEGGEPAIPARDALAVVAMIEAAERSIATGQPVAPASLMAVGRG